MFVLLSILFMDIETTPRQFLVTNQMNITVCVLFDFLWVVGNHQDRLAMLVSRVVHEFIESISCPCIHTRRWLIQDKNIWI